MAQRFRPRTTTWLQCLWACRAEGQRKEGERVPCPLQGACPDLQPPRIPSGRSLQPPEVWWDDQPALGALGSLGRLCQSLRSVSTVCSSPPHVCHLTVPKLEAGLAPSGPLLGLSSHGKVSHCVFTGRLSCPCRVSATETSRSY